MSTSLDQAQPEQTPEAAEPATGHRRLGIALAVITIAQLMVVLDATIANIAIPYIAEDLDFSKSGQSWIITGYTLAFGGLLLLGGRLGDYFGRRRVFMIGVILFGFASLLGGLAQSEALLLSARALQGVGAAIASPTALALITTTFPAGKQRNRAFAVYAAMSGAGAAVGLILGGWLTEYSWRLTFLINVPIGIAAALLAPIFLAESTPRRVKLDLPGAVTGTLGLLGIVYGLTRAGDPSHGWSDNVTITSLVVGAVLLLTFIGIERSVPEPLMPFRILADRTRAVSFVVMMLVPAAMFAMFYFLSIVVQNGMGYSSLEDRLRVPAVQRRHRRLGRHRVQPDEPGRPPVAGRHRHPARRRRAVRLLPDPLRDRRPSNIGVHATYLSDLLPFILMHVVRHGLRLRAADVDRRARRGRARTPGSGPAC